MQGNIVNPYTPWINPVWDIAYIKHYICKSRQEWCDRRLNKLDACGNKIADEKLVHWYENLNGRSPI